MQEFLLKNSMKLVVFLRNLRHLIGARNLKMKLSNRVDGSYWGGESWRTMMPQAPEYAGGRGPPPSGTELLVVVVVVVVVGPRL